MHKDLPSEITEFFLAKEFGWTLEYIRNLSVRDFEVNVVLLEIYNNIKKNDEIKMMKSSVLSKGFF